MTGKKLDALGYVLARLFAAASFVLALCVVFALGATVARWLIGSGERLETTAQWFGVTQVTDFSTPKSRR